MARLLCSPWQVKTIWPRLMLDSVGAHNELTNLLPSHTSSWWPIIEDVFSSPPCLALTESLLARAVEHNECDYLSIDGTFRICLPILGQARFNAPAHEREAAPISDSDSVRRVITVRGRTGAVLGLVPAMSEAAEELRRCLQTALTENALQHVRHVATDSPSGKLLATLSTIMPSLEGVSLDPTHTAMRYEQATNGRRTKGSALLRSLMAKFSAHDPEFSSNIWGPFFGEQSAPALTAAERQLRSCISDGSMSAHRASRILANADKLCIWPTRIQYIEAMAALASRHRTELGRKLEGSKMTVAQILLTATAADKVEWLFNNSRYRAGLPKHVRILLPSGTTSNEALHAELNAWFRQVQAIHRSTLQLKLRVAMLGKLMAHDSSLHYPTTRQMPASHILARRLGSALFSPKAWKEWILDQRQSRCHKHSSLPLAKQRQHEKEVIKGGLKRPAAAMNAEQRRTPFTLQRRPGVKRSGVRLRKPAAR